MGSPPWRCHPGGSGGAAARGLGIAGGFLGAAIVGVLGPAPTAMGPATGIMAVLITVMAATRRPMMTTATILIPGAATERLLRQLSGLLLSLSPRGVTGISLLRRPALLPSPLASLLVNGRTVEQGRATRDLAARFDVGWKPRLRAACFETGAAPIRARTTQNVTKPAKSVGDRLS